MSSKKNKNLTLEEKVKVIEASEVGKLSVREIQRIFGCGKTQVYAALKRKNEIKSEWLKGHGSLKKMPKKTDNEEINKLLWEWFTVMRSQGILISGPMLQAKAKQLAHELGNDTFKASNGWLDSFKNRHNIRGRVPCDTSNSALIAAEEWNLKIADVISGYDPNDVFAGDESGLFFQALPTHMLKFRGEKCEGGKHSKERLTVFLCVNMRGGMERPLVIGNEEHPECFADLKLSDLPVTWRSNKNSWMTVEIMEEWLVSFNCEMQKQNRNVVLFLNDAACHPQLNLSNVKLAWFPTDTKFVANPLAQGINHCMKINYRKLLMQSLIASTEHSDNIDDLSKKITILDATHWLGKAVSDIKLETIQKCFCDAAFTSSTTPSKSFDAVNEAEVGEWEIRRLCMCFGEDVVNFVSVDKDVLTHGDSDSAESMSADEYQVIQGDSTLVKYPTPVTECPCPEVNTDSCKYNEADSVSIVTYGDALKQLEKLIRFSLVNNEPELLECFFSAKSMIERRLVT